MQDASSCHRDPFGRGHTIGISSLTEAVLEVRVGVVGEMRKARLIVAEEVGVGEGLLADAAVEGRRRGIPEKETA